eukprot:507688-Alexandrium_andersonii.AAC.1
MDKITRILELAKGLDWLNEGPLIEVIQAQASKSKDAAGLQSRLDEKRKLFDTASKEVVKLQRNIQQSGKRVEELRAAMDKEQAKVANLKVLLAEEEKK